MRLDVALDELLPHPVEVVWESLTDAGAIAEWLMPNEGFRPEIGTRFRMRTQHAAERAWVYAEVLELEPQRRMVWAWSVEENAKPTVVTFELAPEEGGTRLSLTHVGEIDPVAGGRFTAGWPGRIEALRRHLD